VIAAGAGRPWRVRHAGVRRAPVTARSRVHDRHGAAPTHPPTPPSLCSDGKTGWLADLTNGVGANIQKSTDGGNTWSNTADASELLVLDVTSSGNNVASMGALSAEYSSDGGNTFNTSTVNNPGMGAGQCVRNLGPHDTPIGFAMVGQFGLFTMDDGVAISTDFGATYNPINITNLYTDARYGAFPSANTW
jgi:hypothetical protein